MASDYVQQTWLNEGQGTTPLSAERLNHLESGIAQHAHADSGAGGTFPAIPGAPQLLALMPLPDFDDPGIVPGGSTNHPENIDEFAYVTSADGRYLYIINGYYYSWVPASTRWMQDESSQTFRYDVATDTWTRLADVPNHYCAEGSSAALVNGVIYLIPGDTNSDITGATGLFPDVGSTAGEMSDVMWQYAITTNTWSRGTAPPTTGSYSAACAHNGKVYWMPMYATDDWNETGDIYMYDPVSTTWTQKATAPCTPYDQFELWSDGAFIWFFGGQIPNGVRCVMRYDPTADTWVDMTSQPWAAGFDGRMDAAIVRNSPTSVTIISGWIRSGGRPLDGMTIDTTDPENPILSRARFTLLDDQTYCGATQYQGKIILAGGEGDGPSGALWLNPPSGRYGLMLEDIGDVAPFLSHRDGVGLAWKKGVLQSTTGLTGVPETALFTSGNIALDFNTCSAYIIFLYANAAINVVDHPFVLSSGIASEASVLVQLNSHTLTVTSANVRVGSLQANALAAATGAVELRLRWTSAWYGTWVLTAVNQIAAF